MNTNSEKFLLGVALTSIVLVGVGYFIVRSYERREPVGLPSSVVTTQQPVTENAADLAYIDEVLQTLSQWDRDGLKRLLSEDTLAGSTDEQLDQVLGTLQRRLGELRSYDRPAAQPRVVRQGEPDNLAAYRLAAYFDKGKADVSLVLQQTAGTRQLYAFNVEVSQQL